MYSVGNVACVVGEKRGGEREESAKARTPHPLPAAQATGNGIK